MYVKVRVQAGAKKESFELIGENRFAVSVKQKALQNLANRRVIEIIAAQYRVPPARVRIISGHRSVSKILSVD